MNGRTAMLLFGVVAACIAMPSARAAGESVTFRCTGNQTPSPDERECTPSDGQRVHGTWKIAFNAKAGNVTQTDRLDRVDVFLESQDPNVLSPGQQKKGDPIPPVMRLGDGGPTEACPYCAGENWTNLSDSPNSVDRHYEWNTVALHPYNGLYRIRVEFRKHNSGTTYPDPPAIRKDLRVDNPPSTPPPPDVLKDGSDRFTISWPQPPEPDLVEAPYTLYRAMTASALDRPDDEAFSELVTTDLREFSDRVVEPGAYWYQLKVTRRSPVFPQGISARSGTSPTPGVLAPPTPTPPPPAQQTGPTAPPPGAVRAVPAPRVVVKPPPVPDAPFSALLPFDPSELESARDPGTDEPPLAAEEPDEEPQDGEPASRAGLLPVALGAFMFSAALALGRLPAAAR